MWKVVQEALIFMVFLTILTQVILPPLLSLIMKQDLPMFFLFRKKKAPVAKLSEAEILAKQVDTKINEATQEIHGEEEKLKAAKERLDAVKSKSNQTTNNQKSEEL